MRSSISRETGMLVVEQTVPGGPAHGVLQPGDVLLSMSPRATGAASGAASRPPPRTFCTTFLQLEELLDDSVGAEVAVLLERGGVEIEATLSVADLHSLSPSTLIEVGGCCFHALSYQQARNWNMAPGAVHTAFAGYMLSNAGVPCRAIIKELNTVPTPTLDEAS